MSERRAAARRKLFSRAPPPKRAGQHAPRSGKLHSELSLFSTLPEAVVLPAVHEATPLSASTYPPSACLLSDAETALLAPWRQLPSLMRATAASPAPAAVVADTTRHADNSSTGIEPQLEAHLELVPQLWIKEALGVPPYDRQAETLRDVIQKTRGASAPDRIDAIASWSVDVLTKPLI
jgi:hypothetical protein